MTTQQKRIAKIRKAIEAGNVSLGELSELQDIAATHPQLFADDPVLAESAGIPEEKWRQGLKPATHTPGPWRVGDENRIESPTRGGGAVLVISERKINGTTAAEAQANARLIAAAPDLLAALQDIEQSARKQLDQSATEDGLNNCKRLAAARAAIAKAEGVQQ